MTANIYLGELEFFSIFATLVRNENIKLFAPPILPPSQLTGRTSLYRSEQTCFMGQRKGYKQTPEHRAKRIAAISGPNNYQWTGELVSEKGGRKRAYKAYRNIGPCVRCGEAKSERHHKDGNTANNTPENIEILCRKCHMEVDGRVERMRQLARDYGHLGREAALKKRKNGS